VTAFDSANEYGLIQRQLLRRSITAAYYFLTDCQQRQSLRNFLPVISVIY
jgi:hypothetical protein